jgi:ABC-type multidrug transport system ATPase subunit
MQMIATLTRPSSGRSCSTASTSSQAGRDPRRLGYLPQDFGVYPN